MGITLVVLAAGIGSRYGGLKQIDPVGPAGEIVIDYSIYDALQAGFNRVVCVIRRDIEKDFKACIAAHFEKHIPVDYVFQELSDLPAGFTLPPDRQKPWGTGHAIRACRSALREPFAVINADDFYGRESYRMLADFLRGAPADSNAYSMVGFILRNTLSEHGSVARGICAVGKDDLLHSVVERTKIEKTPGGARFTDEHGQVTDLTGEELVSMNMWGFTPALFPALEAQFQDFLRTRGTDLKAEYFIPTVIDTLIRRQAATARVLKTPESWYGVTYPRDKPVIVAGIREMIGHGLYPEKLWG